MDVDAIHAFLTTSYWAKDISKERVQRCVDNSLCFGVFEGEDQIGFARMVTDKVIFAYMADVYILEGHRGQGLGEQLVKFVLAHPDLQGLRKIMLGTIDAHGLYEKFGFKPIAKPDHLMEIKQWPIHESS